MSAYTYKKNSFYIESERDIEESIYDFDFSNYICADTFSSKEAFGEAVDLDHEINHYVQELSIYSCITEGFFRDYLAAYARDFSSVSGIRFPLDNTDNALYNKSLHLNEDIADTLKGFYELLDVYNFLYKKQHYKPTTKEYEYSAIADPLFSEYSIGYLHLLESYAYHKAYWDYYIKNQSGEGADLLHQLVEDKNVYPIKWRDGGCRIENVKQHIKWNERYQLVNLMTAIGLNYEEQNRPYLEYCEKEIPHNYLDSPAAFYNSVQRLIFETALNTPSIGFIMSSITNHKYDKEVFSPVHRFYKIIKNIRDYGGYPDAVPEEDFYITFFNWCAEQNGWPNYQETCNSIMTMLANRAHEAKEAITNYQFCAVYYKNKQFGRFAQTNATDVLFSQNLPLLVRSRKSIYILQLMSNGVYQMPQGYDFYQAMFRTEKTIKYTPLTKEMRQDELMKIIFQNGQAAIREILYRLFSGATLDAYIYNGTFKCPLHKMGCPTACDKCKTFKKFDDVFENCQKRIFRLGSINEYSPDGDGNTPDCMFFNYLNDYKYNIKQIENGTND